MLESTEVLKLRGDKNRWPCIVANEEFSIKLKQKLKPKRELSNIISELTKLEK